jgi:cell division septum initiation protein DivIVA
MKHQKKRYYFMLVVFMVGASLLLAPSMSQATDTETLERLEQLIKQQEQQIEELQRQVQELEMTGKEVAQPVEEAEEVVEEEPELTLPPDVVTSGNDKVKVGLYGQVNRGVLIANDGNDTYFFNVDNDNSSTRFGINGKARANDDVTI